MRSRSLILTLLALASLVSAHLSAAVPAVARVADPPPDLPAMLLRAADIAEAGLGDGFFAQAPSCLTPQQEAMSMAEARAMKPAKVVDTLKSVGWQQVCGQAYGRTQDPANPQSPPEMMVVSYVHLYEDADGAAEGFAFFEDDSYDTAAEDLAEGGDIGDLSEATVSSGTDNGGAFQSLDLTFQLDNLVAGVTIHDYTGATPEYATAEALAEVLQDRIDAALTSDEPNLAAMVVRIGEDGLPPLYARYVFIDGEAEQSATESDEEFARRVENYGGAERVLQTRQSIPASAGATMDYRFDVTLYQFPTERAAKRWVRNVVPLLEVDPKAFDPVARDDAPTYGDASVAYSHGETLSNGGAVVHDRVAASVGTIGVVVGIRGAMVPQGVAEKLIGPEIACIEDGACSQTVEVPGVLRGATADATTPESEATKAPKSGKSTGRRATRAKTYTSELYSFTLTYGADWTFGESQVVADTEIVALSTDAMGVVMVAGTSSEGDVDACLNGAIAYIEDDPDNAKVRVMKDADGKRLRGSDGDIAYAAYSYTNADGTPMILIAQCRVLVPDEATLEISAFVAEADVADQAALLDDLLAGLEIGE